MGTTNVMGDGAGTPPVEVCRTCLSPQELAPLFPEPVQYRSLQLTLLLTTGLQIKRDDGLPQAICINCTESINTANLFRMRCRVAELTLLQTYHKFDDSRVLTTTSKEKIQKRPIVSGRSDTINVDIKSESEQEPLLPESLISSDGQDQLSIENPLKIKNDLLNNNNELIMQMKTETPNLEAMKLENDNKNVPPAGPGQPEREGLFADGIDTARIKNYLKTEIKTEIAEQSEHDSLVEKGQVSPAVKKRFRSKRGHEPYLELVEGPLDSSGPIQCKVCKKFLRSRNSFGKHVLIHLGYPQLCEHCGKRYVNSTALVRHLRSLHGMEHDLRCQLCEFRPLDKGQLATHVRARHTGERPFVCELCGAGFAAKRHLRQHLPTHSELRPVQCAVCPSQFKTKHDLVVHAAKVHRPPAWSYQCYVCDKSFTRGDNTKTHVRRVHRVPFKRQKPMKKIPLR